MPGASADLPMSLEEVEHLFKDNEIDEDLQVQIFKHYFNEKSRNIIAKLPESSVDTFPKLRDALLAEHRPTPQCHYSNWLRAHKKMDETTVKFNTRLNVLFRYYIKSRKIENDDYKALFDLMIADKLKSTLDHDTYEYCQLKEDSETFSSQKIAEMADFYKNEDGYSGGGYRQKGNKFHKKFENKNEEHKSSNQTLNKSEKGDSASAKKADDSQGKASGFDPNWRAKKDKYQKQNVNQFSHFSHSKNGASEGSRACYTCGSKDHLANFHRIPKTSQTKRVCATEVGDGQICTDAQSDKLSQSDQHPHDTGCNMFGDIFVER